MAKMKIFTTISEERALKLLNALKPGWRETVMADIEAIVHNALSDLLSTNMDCDDCPIYEYCAEHRYTVCESVIYHYLEKDFEDGTNAKKVKKE